jgi:protein dpy-30
MVLMHGCCCAAAFWLLQEPGLFHHTLVNGELEQAYLQLQHLINAHVPGLLPQATAAAAPAVQEAEQAAAGAAAAVSTDVSSEQPAAVVAAAADASIAAAPEPIVLANGTAAGVAAAAAAAAAVAHSNGGTSTLLDFGFGASAGPAVAAKGMPVRQYMDVTVIPVLREGLKALNVARPDDPWQFLADYLVANKPLAHA